MQSCYILWLGPNWVSPDTTVEGSRGLEMSHGHSRMRPRKQCCGEVLVYLIAIQSLLRRINAKAVPQHAVQTRARTLLDIPKF